MLKLSDKTISYLKLFSTGIILIWLYLKSPLNPVYSQVSRIEYIYIVFYFIIWIFASVFLFWTIYANKYSIFREKTIYFVKQIDLSTVIVFVFSFVLFFLALSGSFSENHIITDIEIHSKMILRINHKIAFYPVNFLYYFFVNLLSGFSKQLIFIWLSSAMILAFSVSIKYLITKIIIRNLLSKHNGDLINKHKVKPLLIILSLGLIVFFPIQDYAGQRIIGLYYLGKITPNLWHNSTTIFLMPFSLLLFYLQYKQLSKKVSTKSDEIIVISILVFLNLIIKPSFFLVYGPVTTIYLFFKHKLSKEFFKGMIPVILGFLILYAMHSLIFIERLGELMGHGGSKIVFSKPFEAFLNYIPGWYLPISFFLSLTFPIFYLFFFKDVLRKLIFRYALSLTVFGFCLSFFLIESEPRRYDGNFLWQNTICYYILLMTLSYDFTLKLINEGLKSYKMKIITTIFAIHVLSGLVYLYKIIFHNFH